MTNGDWIRIMTDEELARNVINPCMNYECGECPMRNQRGKCVIDSNSDGKMTLEWLESEHR